MVVRRKMMGLQLLFVALLYPPVIVAEDLDPVEFLISKNYPKNKSLIPLPKNFDKFGDQKNDCCALQLFIEVKDYNAEGTGNGDGYSDNESQTETGSVTFNFEHPAIRKSDIKFTMRVEKDKAKVKSKNLLNFDNCTNIIYKTFNISATTTIADDKDVRVVLVNGKDHKIVCTDPNLAPAPEPREDQAHNDIVYVCVIAALIIGWLLTLLYYNYRKIKEMCSEIYKLTTSQKPEVINLSESAASEADSDSDTSKVEKGGVVKEKRGGRENLRLVEGASNLRTESEAPYQPELTEEKHRPRSKSDVSSNSDADSSDEERGSVNNIKSVGVQPKLTEIKECDNNEKYRPRSKPDVSSNPDSNSSHKERGSENLMKSLKGQPRGKKTSTEGVDKCGWITKIRKNKPLFFNGVITCVWIVLSVIIVGIVYTL